jgi:hypothetical protein
LTVLPRVLTPPISKQQRRCLTSSLRSRKTPLALISSQAVPSCSSPLTSFTYRKANRWPA